MPHPSLERIKETRWFRSRPKAVRETILRLPPGDYRMRDTGQLCSLYSYEENKQGGCDTVKVLVPLDDGTARLVFGVPVSDLQLIEAWPCDPDREE